VKRDYSSRTYQELVGDVNKLHKFTRQLVTERDRFERRSEWQKIWIRILAAAITVQFAALGYLASCVLSHLVKR
jgi:hypothetical protein